MFRVEQEKRGHMVREMAILAKKESVMTGKEIGGASGANGVPGSR